MEAVWWCVAVFPSWEKAMLVITGGDFNAESYPDEIPQSVAIPYFRNLGVNAILQDDTAYTHRARFINEFGSGEDGVACLDLNLSEHLWDQLERAVRA